MEAVGSKRPAEDEIVQVFGFGRPWSFTHGFTAGDVIDFVASQCKWRSNEIAIQDRSSSSQESIVLKQTVLALGRKYVFIGVSKPDTDAQRTFAVGTHADPRRNYFVPPDVRLLVKKLREGKYGALCGARQSGKTTMAMAVKEELSMDPDTCVVYLDKVSLDRSWDKSRFWCTLWNHLHIKCRDLFPQPTGEDFTELSFKSLFHVDALPLKVTLIVDEADALRNASPACLDDFLSTIKSMKEDPEGYNLNGVLLIGVETVKDLLQGQAAQKDLSSASPNIYSPFTYAFLTEPVRFGVEDIEKLLRQAESDRPDVTIQVDRIARSVMDYTGGHKGIVGLCLEILVTKELWTYRLWIEEAESVRLSTYVFQRQTYSRILSACRAQVDVVERFLGVEALLCDDVALLELRNLLAEGVLFAKEAYPAEGYEVSISSPLLRAVILRRCVVTSEMVDAPPQPYRVDPLWTVLEAIRSLDMGMMCRPETLKATGEIGELSYHFTLFARLKAVLRHAYPTVDAKVLCECKQAVEYLEKRTNQKRVHIVVRNNDNFSKFGCQLVVNNDVQGHLNRAAIYAKEHGGAQMYVINFSMQDVAEIVTPEHSSVVFISVHINPSGNQTTAQVTIVQAGKEEDAIKMDLELKKWDGKISYDQI